MSDLTLNKPYLIIHPQDNVLVALIDMEAGVQIDVFGKSFLIKDDVKAKHKFAMQDLHPGDEIRMYGIKVGTADSYIPQGGVLDTSNVRHQTEQIKPRTPRMEWQKPDISEIQNLTFDGFHRSDGRVGTANYWLVLPLVFCENGNIDIIKDAVNEALGQNKNHDYRNFARTTLHEYLSSEIQEVENKEFNQVNHFPNVDGVRFITHQMGCGGTRQDAGTLCGLLAGYITHPNVAGVTVLSLGCQNAQFEILQEEIEKRNPNFDKPVHYFNQQSINSEEALIKEAIRSIFEGLVYANQMERKPAPISKLVIGLECGGSDGFSGISANPVLGEVSDLLIAAGGSTILSEFPELCGVEQEIIDRCSSESAAEKFIQLMRSYAASAERAGSGFDMNPSPGNIKDGLITDAMKSAGAAKKGGTSPVEAVLDYPEMQTTPGLNLLCTPGNDVESTTALVGSGSNIVLFTTGLGTPTGNPIAPVIKVSSNNQLALRMPGIIDFNTGTVITGEENIKESAYRLIHLIIEIASGRSKAKATLNQQFDFIPWKRGVFL